MFTVHHNLSIREKNSLQNVANLIVVSHKHWHQIKTWNQLLFIMVLSWSTFGFKWNWSPFGFYDCAKVLILLPWLVFRFFWIFFWWNQFAVTRCPVPDFKDELLMLLTPKLHSLIYCFSRVCSWDVIVCVKILSVCSGNFLAGALFANFYQNSDRKEDRWYNAINDTCLAKLLWVDHFATKISENPLLFCPVLTESRFLQCELSMLNDAN